MNKYIKQRQKYDCSPTAVFNALVYYRQNPKLKLLKELRKDCMMNFFGDNKGTPSFAFVFCLSKYFTYSQHFYPSSFQRKKIFKMMEKYPAIITYHIGDKQYHTIFVKKYYPRTNRMLVVNNFQMGGPLSYIIKDVADNKNAIFYILKGLRK